jgi:pimeloyl-ACP methyl ester carboxylesterase
LADLPKESNDVPAPRAQPQKTADLALDIPKESIAKVTAPVLTIHGRKGRNAPYGGGREWDMLLPNARLITIDAAAQYVLG